MVDIRHYIFVQMIECTTPKVNPNVYYGLWVIMMCQQGLSIVTNVSLWWSILIEREFMHVWGLPRWLNDKENACQ